MYRNNIFYSGFTLVELLVTIAIFGVLAALAVPGMQEFIQNNRVGLFASDFMTDLQIAKSEAVKRGTSVSMCAASNSAFSACGNSSNWANGWIIFVDADANGVLASTNDRIKIRNALEPGKSVATNEDVITFSSEGFVTTGSGAYTLQATGCTGNHARNISVASTGRVAVSTASCS